MSEMGFSDIIQALLDGKHITRKEWDDKRTYGVINDHILCIRKSGDKEERPWILTDADLLSDDWIIL